ncbi:MAG TPA: hypothetical protein VFZ67_11955 [Nitrososphaera sp.]
MKSKKKQKPFDPDKEKRIIKFAGMLPLSNYQRDYFIGYPYRYWLHKGRALMHFIEARSRLSTLRLPKDNDTDDYIIENLKMEIHMMVFHSAESLFLTVLGHYFYPDLPWFWMSTCTQNKFNNIMNLWQEKGLDAIIKEPEKWLRDALFPTINESRKEYQKTKESATFAKKYLNRLVREYMRHKEYNAYKHGLRVFPGHGRVQATTDEATGEVAAEDIQGDILEFLTYELPAGHDYEYRIKRTSKKYDVNVDIGIISITTWLLQNFLERKRVESKATPGQEVTFNSVLLDNFKVEDIFRLGYFEMSV